MHELFNVLCFQYRMVSVEYFMDTMQEWEISDICACLDFADKQQWEMTRLLMYQNIQLNTSKQLEVKDILKFKWEKDDLTEQEISTEDINRLKEQSSQIFSMIKTTEIDAD